MKVVPAAKKDPVAKDFTSGDQGKVPGKNTLVGKIIQIFEKYGGNSANKDGLDGCCFAAETEGHSQAKGEKQVDDKDTLISCSRRLDTAVWQTQD